MLRKQEISWKEWPLPWKVHRDAEHEHLGALRAVSAGGKEVQGGRSDYRELRHSQVIGGFVPFREHQLHLLKWDKQNELAPAAAKLFICKRKKAIKYSAWFLGFELPPFVFHFEHLLFIALWPCLPFISPRQSLSTCHVTQKQRLEEKISLYSKPGNFYFYPQLLELIAKSQLTSLSGIAQKNFMNILEKVVLKGELSLTLSPLFIGMGTDRWIFQ